MALVLATIALPGCASETLSDEDLAEREALIDSMDQDPQTSNRDRRMRTRDRR